MLLDGVVMNYPWGRHDFIADLQRRRVPSVAPEAELWFGAHPNGASPVQGMDRCATLIDVLHTDPTGWLGSDVVATYGPHLPFLLKVLAVNEPLSLQLHPDAALVASLVADGNAEQILADHHPKPEMVVALGSLHALCGLRDAVDACAVIDEIVALANDDAWLTVRQHVNDDGVAAAVAELVTASDSHITALLAALHRACASTFSAAHASDIRDLLLRYPTDRSVAIAVLMQLVVLADGEALYIPAGVLHCYLRGAGIEVMASSDNVLRVGLTTKARHPKTVIRQLRASFQQATLVRGERDGNQCHYPVDTTWFALTRITVLPSQITRLSPKDGPQLLLVAGGDLTVREGCEGEFSLAQGAGLFVAAGTADVSLYGQADVFVASLGASQNHA